MVFKTPSSRLLSANHKPGLLMFKVIMLLITIIIIKVIIAVYAVVLIKRAYFVKIIKRIDVVRFDNLRKCE